jgi:lycopene beta-cyclase
MGTSMTSESSFRSPFDLILVGGGLQNCLIALAVLERRPRSRIAMIEKAERICGNHTWSFHSSDVTAAAAALVDPLVATRWPGYDVAFPAFTRSLGSAYATITSERLRTVVEARLASTAGSVLLTGRTAAGIEASSVTLDDGTMLSADLVVDARGPSCTPARELGGYQKFAGLELLLAEPSPHRRPMLMDARIPQTDGFRFFYVLPFDSRRVLVEDTYFSDTPDLDTRACEPGILEYARSSGMRVEGIVRRESGVLPMPTKMVPSPRAGSPLLGGYAGGWFHPATAYSFPVALRLALHVARSAELFGAAWQRLVTEHRTQFRFATWLNRLLFGAFHPETRFGAFERFYRSDEATIARFYALETTRADRVQMLCGRPPRGLALPFAPRRMAS